ncbi:centromere protein M isoform X2 [Lampetra planeri]
MAVLHPFAKLPEPRTATVLLVGAVGPGQSALAEAMCRINSPFSINVHIASKLPLPGHNEHRRPRIDLILLLIDLTSINSLRVVEDSLRLLSASFFIGRVFFAITKDPPVGYILMYGSEEVQHTDIRISAQPACIKPTTRPVHFCSNKCLSMLGSRVILAVSCHLLP